MGNQQVEPGTFCWVELATKDEAGAKKFYGELFEWESEAHSMGGDHGAYHMLSLGGTDVGGLYKLMPEMLAGGVPPNWLSYVMVDDAIATTEKAKALGAQLIMGPMDVMDKGRMSVFADPTGASFAIWQALGDKGPGRPTEPGAPCWNELMTSDTAKAGEFYAALFGWSHEEMPMGPMTYTIFKHEDVQVGGMMSKPPEMGAAPSNWMVYFSVSDCDEQVARATELGANVFAPAMDIEGIGRLAGLIDPQGAFFSIIKLAEPPA